MYKTHTKRTVEPRMQFQKYKGIKHDTVFWK